MNANDDASTARQMQIQFVNRCVELQFIPSRYMRNASKVIVRTLHANRAIVWEEVRALEDLRGTPSQVPADFVLAQTISRSIKLPERSFDAVPDRSDPNANNEVIAVSPPL